LHFGTLEPTINQFVAPFAAYPVEVVATLPTQMGRDVSDPGVTAWIVVRQSQRDVSAGVVGFGSRNEVFPLVKTVAWLAMLNGDVAEIIFPEELCDRVVHDDITSRKRRGQIVLKHDIHRDLRRTLLMAETEAKAHIHGIYFMMGPHEINEQFYDYSSTWDALRRIQSLGHRIGLHLDTIDTILRHGDLYSGLAHALDRFRREHLHVAYGNCHGNTAFKDCGFRPMDFFAELAPPKAEQPVDDHLGLKDHVGRYSLHEIADQFGIDYWLDNSVRRRGSVVGRCLYVTDNTGALVSPVFRSDRFNIDDAFIDVTRRELARTDALVLLHPQYYDRTADANVVPRAVER
jgi:hypothetical protein